MTVSYLNARADNEFRYVSAATAVAAERRIIETSIRAFATDLLVIAGLESLRAFLNGDTGYINALSRDFRNMTAGKPLVAQLRFIDDRGLEQVRIERRAPASTVDVVPELQYKGDRSYFLQASTLPSGGIYVSAIDLNVEFGEVQEPWRPTLRLATPLHDQVGAFAGIVVVNLDMFSLIDEKYTEHFGENEALQILNARGYWLSGVEDDLLWGFVFDRPTSMAETRPDIWRSIASERTGTIAAEGETIVFAHADPVLAIEQSAIDIPEVRAAEAWKIVAVVPDVAFVDLLHPGLYVVAAAGLMMNAVIAYTIARALLARRIAEASSQRAVAEISKNERMASLGSLVAGVAHELNTPIGISVTIASALSERVEEFDRAVAAGTLQRKHINKIQQDLREGTRLIMTSLQRASGLISHFKQVAVDQTSAQRRRFEIESFLEDLTVSLQPRFRAGGVTLEISNDVTVVLDSFPGLLSQVLINLIENARIHAFSEGEVGKVILSVRMTSDDYIEMTVRDNGRGIPADVLGRIFEPFFTTRLGQGGSGLGLSISFNIATGALGGTISAESEVGSGTSITVNVPVVAPAAKGSLLGKTYDA